MGEFVNDLLLDKMKIYEDMTTAREEQARKYADEVDRMTVKSLKNECDKKHIDIRSDLRKPELLEIVRMYTNASAVCVCENCECGGTGCGEFY